MKSLVKHFIVWVLFFWAGKWVRLCIAFDISIFVCLFVFVDEPQPLTQLNGSLLAPGPLPPLTTPPTPPMDSPLPSVCPIMPTPTPPLIPPSSSSPGCGSGSASTEQPGSGPLVSGAASTSASNSPTNPETEEDKAKKLLYCSLCKVAVNSLSQLEAHNKGGLICELRGTEYGCRLWCCKSNNVRSAIRLFPFDPLLTTLQKMKHSLNHCGYYTRCWRLSFQGKIWRQIC